MEDIRKFLIVDDDALFLNLLAQALRKRGIIAAIAAVMKNRTHSPVSIRILQKIKSL